MAHAHAPSWPSLYTTKAERHEGQKRKTARALELMSSVVVSPAPRARVRARDRARVGAMSHAGMCVGWSPVSEADDACKLRLGTPSSKR